MGTASYRRSETAISPAVVACAPPCGRWSGPSRMSSRPPLGPPFRSPRAAAAVTDRRNTSLFRSVSGNLWRPITISVAARILRVNCKIRGSHYCVLPAIRESRNPRSSAFRAFLGRFENDSAGPARCGFFGGAGCLFDRRSIVGRHSKAEDGVFSLVIGQLVASHTDERSRGLLAVNPQSCGPAPAGESRGMNEEKVGLPRSSCAVGGHHSPSCVPNPGNPAARWLEMEQPARCRFNRHPPGLRGPSGRGLDRHLSAAGRRDRASAWRVCRP